MPAASAAGSDFPRERRAVRRRVLVDGNAVTFMLLAARRVYLPLAIVVAALAAGLSLGYLLLLFLLFASDGWAS
jgi:hypothetical protein